MRRFNFRHALTMANGGALLGEGAFGRQNAWIRSLASSRSAAVRATFTLGDGCEHRGCTATQLFQVTFDTVYVTVYAHYGR